MEDWSGRRADARRNHERVLAAAIEVFTEQGLDATVPEIAARAGVGKATVYRSYPAKADLIDAIAQLHLGWLQSVITAAAEEAEVDAYRALSEAVLAITTRLAKDRLMVEVLTRMEDWEPDSATDSSAERILDLGRQQGTLRDDVTMMDLQVLVGGTAHVLLELGVTDPATWERYTNLALAALRP
ncbi:helix-turn-helix domain containing protein [Nocardioides sp. CER19]|uniref:TetR/AcrR family transcriptional regulator n=1 Tax=Nocardioides sp. CER19 TaxID=3038538 RepID=UPI00244C68A1|nr:helix-turn-helix domain containing protein [Nocardioides sp. CER19]MDH2414469.1 helix-turn-helix domain containing protein [Nocardioides sp. CER19]